MINSTLGIGVKPDPRGSRRGAATIVAFVTVLLSAQAAWGARVVAPVRLTPGRVVTVRIVEFPPESSVRVQLASFRSFHSNCCVSLVYPDIHQPGIVVPVSGSVSIEWRVPRYFARCVMSICPTPEYQRFEPGERVAVDVSTAEDAAFAEAKTRIALPPGSRSHRTQGVRTGTN